MNEMLAGAIAMGALVAALYFLRFWKSSGDRFFLYFALSFFLQALNRVLLAFSSLHDEDTPLYYVVRLAAYALILFAIVQKNRQRGQPER